MVFYFDQNGFLSAEPIAGRETDQAPPPETEWPSGQRPNWTGYQWVNLDYPPSFQSVPLEPIRAMPYELIQAFVVALPERGAVAWQQIRASQAPRVLTFLEIFDRMQALGERINTAHPLLAQALGSLEQTPQPGYEQAADPPMILRPGEAAAIIGALKQISAGK
jgi:hypothetical protein